MDNCRVCNCELSTFTNWSMLNKRANRKICKPCGRVYIKKWMKDNPGKNYEYHKKRKNTRQEETPIYAFRNNLRSRRRWGHIIEITPKFLESLWIANPNCSYCDVNMTWSTGKQGGKALPTSITVDRITLEQGYIETNVKLCCFRCNCLKGDGTYDDMIKYAERLLKFNKIHI